jgi:hypothetical protein
MRLEDLREIEHTPQPNCCRRDLNGHQIIASFARRYEVAYWADATSARRKRWHLREWPALTELLEAAKLRNVKLRLIDITGVG